MIEDVFAKQQLAAQLGALTPSAQRYMAPAQISLSYMDGAVSHQAAVSVPNDLVPKILSYISDVLEMSRAESSKQQAQALRPELGGVLK